MAEKKIKVGLVGIGRAGWGMHSKEIELYKDLFSMKAAIDIDELRLEEMKKRFPSCKTYLDYDKFLADKNIDLVVVANRSPDHTSYALKALEAGKYVFIEKPIALTYADAKKLVAAAKKYPGKLFCRHNRRFESEFAHIREIIKSGILGDIFEIKHCVHSFQRRNDWQAIIECGGGQLNNWGPHLIDHALQMLESPVKEIWSDLKLVTAAGDAEDHVKIILKGKNGRIFDLEISGGVTLSSPQYAVYGTKGSLLLPAGSQEIQLKYLDPKKKLADIKAAKESPPITGAFVNAEKLEFIEEKVKVNPSNGDTIWSIYKYLFNAIRKGENYPVTIEEASEVVRVTEAVKNNSSFKMKPAKTSKKK